MNTRNAVTLLLYILANFAMAALWHLVLFADVLAVATPFARETPVFALGLSAMLVQGILLIAIYPGFHSASNWLRSGLQFGAMAGLFLASGAIWVEVGKFAFAEPTTYLVLETVYEVVSFAVLGGIVAWRYRSEAA